MGLIGGDPITWAGELHVPAELVERVGPEQLIDLIIEHWSLSRNPPEAGMVASLAFSSFDLDGIRVCLKTAPGDRTDIWVATEAEAEASL